MSTGRGQTKLELARQEIQPIAGRLLERATQVRESRTIDALRLDRYLRRDAGVSLETIKASVRPMIAGLASAIGRRIGQ